MVLAICGELFGMLPFAAVAIMVESLLDGTATTSGALALFAVALGGQLLRLALTFISTLMSHKATYRILKNMRSAIAEIGRAHV